MQYQLWDLQNCTTKLIHTKRSGVRSKQVEVVINTCYQWLRLQHYSRTGAADANWRNDICVYCILVPFKLAYKVVLSHILQILHHQTSSHELNPSTLLGAGAATSALYTKQVLLDKGLLKKRIQDFYRIASACS
jgi:hypothetical protein